MLQEMCLTNCCLMTENGLTVLNGVLSFQFYKVKKVIEGYRRFMVIEACLGVIEYLIFEHNNISKSYLGVNKYLNISNEVNFSNVYVYLHLLSLSIGMVRFSMLINTLLIVTDSF